jgi:hypothetical protein
MAFCLRYKDELTANGWHRRFQAFLQSGHIMLVPVQIPSRFIILYTFKRKTILDHSMVQVQE